MEAINDQLILPVSQIQKQSFKAGIKNQIMEGTLNPLEFYRRAKLIDECVEELKKDPEILEAAQQERALYGKEKPVVNGSVVDTGSRTTYDYKACNDPVWEDLKRQIADREKLLKALPPEGMADPNTGLIIYPPAEKISEFITVKI